jgi:hypothetical protein
VLQHIGAGQLSAEFTEVESGRKHTNRPELLAALQECRRKKATLVIAKLDRLARNVAFISTLMESGAEILCCDNPHANRLMLHMLAAFAEHEREQIAKARGVKLGNPRFDESIHLARAARPSGMPAPEVFRIMEDLRSKGRSFRAIADELNRLNIKTGRGCQWHGVTVKAAIEQQGRAEHEEAA